MADPGWMKGLLVVHIAGRFTAFLLAPVALATAKGGKQRRRWGMVYLWAMGVVATTAIPMALYRPVLTTGYCKRKFARRSTVVPA